MAHIGEKHGWHSRSLGSIDIDLFVVSEQAFLLDKPEFLAKTIENGHVGFHKMLFRRNESVVHHLKNAEFLNDRIYCTAPIGESIEAVIVSLEPCEQVTHPRHLNGHRVELLVVELLQLPFPIGILFLTLPNDVDKRLHTQIATLGELNAAKDLLEFLTFAVVIKERLKKRRIVIADQNLAKVENEVFIIYSTIIRLACKCMKISQSAAHPCHLVPNRHPKVQSRSLRSGQPPSIPTNHPKRKNAFYSFLPELQILSKIVLFYASSSGISNLCVCLQL